jgi:hypothetical protein
MVMCTLCRQAQAAMPGPDGDAEEDAEEEDEEEED